MSPLVLLLIAVLILFIGYVVGALHNIAADVRAIRRQGERVP